MKLKLVLFLIVVVFCVDVNAQSVVITGREVTYTRPKPMSEYKKTFEINYPIVKAATPALSKKIETAISYQSVLGLKLNEELGTYGWLDSADYEVLFNKNGILNLRLWMEGSAAYPSNVSKVIVVNLKTGLTVRPKNVFTNTASLLSLVTAAKNKEVSKALIEMKKDGEFDGYEDVFKNSAKYHHVSLEEFTITDNGIIFHHDYGFAHAIQALQPPGEFFFTWAQLKPYIKPGSLLSRIAR